MRFILHILDGYHEIIFTMVLHWVSNVGVRVSIGLMTAVPLNFGYIGFIHLLVINMEWPVFLDNNNIG